MAEASKVWFIQIIKTSDEDSNLYADTRLKCRTHVVVMISGAHSPISAWVLTVAWESVRCSAVPGLIVTPDHSSPNCCKLLCLTPLCFQSYTENPPRYAEIKKLQADFFYFAHKQPSPTLTKSSFLLYWKLFECLAMPGHGSIFNPYNKIVHA